MIQSIGRLAQTFRLAACRRLIPRVSAVVCVLLLLQGSPTAWRVSMPTARVNEEESRNTNSQEEQREASNAKAQESLATGRLRSVRRVSPLHVRLDSALRCGSMDHRGLALRTSLPPDADPQRACCNGFGGPLTI